MKLKDKVVVVTGSTRGIGRAIAEECAKEGAKVMLCSRHKASVQEMVKQGGGILINMNGKGGRCEASPFLTAYASTKAAISSLTKSLAREYKEYPISIHSVTPGMVDTDFYKDMKTSPKLADNAKSIPYVLKAFGVPVTYVAHFCTQIAAQEPGKSTGRNYSLLSGRRLVRAILLMMYYRVTSKVKVRM